MNQQALVEAVAETIGASKAEAAKAVGAVLDAIRGGLKRGEKVALSGFGVFEPVERGPRKGRNVRTGQPLDIPAATQVRFRPGKALKDAIQGAAGPP